MKGKGFACGEKVESAYNVIEEISNGGCGIKPLFIKRKRGSYSEVTIERRVREYLRELKLLQKKKKQGTGRRTRETHPAIRNPEPSSKLVSLLVRNYVQIGCFIRGASIDRGGSRVSSNQCRTNSKCSRTSASFEEVVLRFDI